MSLLLKHFDKTGGAEITAESWTDLVAGDLSVARKYSVQNVGDRPYNMVVESITQVGDNDGFSFARIGLDVATVPRPFGLAAVLGPAGGVWGSTGVRGWVVTAINGLGETIASLEASFNVTDLTKKVTLTWTTVPGATGYKVYRTDTPGTYVTPALRATLGVVGTFDDDGAVLVAGAPPTTNLTAGGPPNFGTPPALGGGSLALGILSIGEEVFYWVNWVVAAATPELGNPRQFDLTFRET